MSMRGTYRRFVACHCSGRYRSNSGHAVSVAYASVFGHPSNPAVVHFFVDQLNFFEDLYTAAGVFGSPANVDLLARGAIYGQMLGMEAEINPFGPGGAAGTADVSIVGVSATSDTMHGVSHIS